GVAGQEYSAGSVVLGQAGGVAEAGQPAGGVHPEVGACHGMWLLFEFVDGGWGGAVLGEPLGRYDDAVGPVSEGAEAESFLGFADFGDGGGQGLGVHVCVHFSQECFVLGGFAGEVDPGLFAYGAASSVAADEVAGA